MKIILLYIILQFFTFGLFSQFTKSQVEELTAMGIAAAIEPEDPVIVETAQELTADYEVNDYISRICAIFDNVYGKWNYQHDPGGMEYFEKAGVSVYTYTGDCDDYSSLMVSLIKAAGGDGRVVCVSGHAYPEIYLGKDMTETEIESIRKKINSYYEDKGSKRRLKDMNYHGGGGSSLWLNLDYQERVPGGRFFEYSPDAEHLVIYPNGSYELAYLNK